jgi:hypothetical protein
MSVPDSDEVPKIILTRVPAAGLIAAAITAIAIGHLPPPHFVSRNALLISAAGRVGLIFLSSALSNFSFYRTKGISGISAWRTATRASIGALWLAPLALFVSEDSSWALVVTAIFVVSVGLTFRRARNSSDENYDAPRSMLGDGTLQASRSRTHLFAAAAALIAEVGAVSGGVGFLFGGTLLVAIGCIVWVWSLNREWLLAADSDSRSGAKLAFTIAVVLTAIGLLPYLSRGYGSGGYATYPGTEAAQQSRSQRESRQPKPEDTGSRDAYSGIVVLPRTQVTKLVAPPTVALGESLSPQTGKPLVIPFDGVYWLFRAPDTRMPKQPHKILGSPEDLAMRSTDWHALSMEAHQNLGTFVDLGCCQRIQVAIRNADHYPGTVSLELIVSNTSLPGKPSQSLGTDIVQSTRPWKFQDDRPPTNEVLQFEIPAQGKLQRFDELTVIFRMTPRRSFSAARVGIEQFVLLPRGL